MAQRVGLKRFQDIVTLSDVVHYFDVNDINQNINTAVYTLTKRYGTPFAYSKVGTNACMLQIDSAGHKVLRCSNYTFNNDWFQNSSELITQNNNETWIGVYSLPTGAGILGLITKSAPGQLSSSQWSYGDFIVGSGLLVTSAIYNQKIILTGTVNAGQMNLYVGMKKVGSINNPVLPTPTPIADQIFRLPGGTITGDVDFYSAIRIQNTYSEENLKRLIRLVAAEHGVKL